MVGVLRLSVVSDKDQPHGLQNRVRSRVQPAGDIEGEAVWLRVIKAIEELLSEERPDDAEVH